MNSKPRRSHFSQSDEVALLESLGAARRRLTLLCAATSPNGDRYKRCSAILAAIDDLAGDLAGDRTHFHAKPHG
jgi:hypothetical protein